MSVSALGDEKWKLSYFCSYLFLFGIPQENWDLLYIIGKLFLKGIQCCWDCDCRKWFSSYRENLETRLTTLDLRGGLLLFPCLDLQAAQLAMYEYLRCCYGLLWKGTDFPIGDHHRNHRSSWVNIRLYLVFPISPLLLIGFQTNLVLTESHSPGKSNAVGYEKLGAELAEDIG